MNDESTAGSESGTGKRVYSVPAAEKALDILEFMAAQVGGLTATEIANLMGRSVHEVYRLLVVLEARGYLYQRVPSDGYRLSLKLFDLAHRMPSVRRLSDSALHVMQSLAPAALQSCHLGVLSGHEFLIVLQVDNPLPMRYSVMLGAKFDFAETSGGTVLYAFAGDRRRDQLLDWLRDEGRTPEEIAAVEARALQIRAAGYEMRESLAVSGVTNIAAPVFDHQGRAVAALTLPYVPQRAATVPRDEARAMVLEAARTISRNLGAGVVGAG
ncbi:MAG: IclR family transcriptional regulator [Rubellimicrobium sp.]|nr:IclR family transcriptional regulator [Rubellimicrobium sp.]